MVIAWCVEVWRADAAGFVLRARILRGRAHGSGLGRSRVGTDGGRKTGDFQ